MDLSELFTASARQVLPVARAKGLVSYFDYRGPDIRVLLDENLLRAALHQLFMAVTESLDQGFVTLVAETAMVETDRCAITVHAAGTGRIAPEADLASVLLQLGVPSSDLSRTGGVAWQALLQHGAPDIEVAMAFRHERGVGLLYSWHAVVPALPVPAHDAPHASGAPAWLVSALPGGLDSVEIRLRRQGWDVIRLDSLHAVQGLLAGPVAGGEMPPPLLLMVGESVQDNLGALQALSALPSATRRVLAVVAGSPTLTARDATHVDIRVLPMSPAEMDDFARHVDPGCSTVLSRGSVPVPQYAQALRRVLVVEDNAVNQLVARGLLELLGCEVEVAADGVGAIACCRARPPDLVLMDMHMPVLDGLETARALRRLQHQGVVPPFPIVAATATHEAQGCPAALAAGMDGFLSKPLALRQLDDEMHRVLPMQPLLPGVAAS